MLPALPAGAPRARAPADVLRSLAHRRHRLVPGQDGVSVEFIIQNDELTNFPEFSRLHMLSFEELFGIVSLDVSRILVIRLSLEFCKR